MSLALIISLHISQSWLCLLKPPSHSGDEGRGLNSSFGWLVLLQAEQTWQTKWRSQRLLRWCGLQPPEPLSGLSSLCGSSVKMRALKTRHDILDMALCWKEWNNHASWFAGCSLANAAQYVVSLYHCAGTLLCVHIVLCCEPTELLSVQPLPNLSGCNGYGSVLIFELRDVPFGQGTAMVILHV